jgi:hypothetical protein
MARNLTSVPDIKAPDAEYPSGRIQNEETTPTPITGTPIIEELYGDLVQFFHKLMRLAGLSYNALADSETNGFQFITALAAYIRTVTASTTQRGSVELSTDAETQAGIDTQRAVTPASLESKTATTTRKGIARLATVAEVQSGLTYNDTIVTPHALEQKKASELANGIVKKATLQNAIDGVDDDPGSSQKYIAPSIFKAFNGGLMTKIVSIGAWDMDVDNFIEVTHGLGVSIDKIIGADAYVRDDANTLKMPLNSDGTLVPVFIDITKVTLYRVNGGYFDNPGFSLTTFSRGYIIIKYLP